MTRWRYMYLAPLMDVLDLRLQLMRRFCKFFSGCLYSDNSILAMASKLFMQNRSVVVTMLELLCHK